MIVNGRQLCASLDEVRDDHKARYRAAGAYFRKHGRRRVVDVGCGCGYGAFILASEFRLDVVAIDLDPQALTFAERHYGHVKITHLLLNAMHVAELGAFDAICALEVIEHMEAPPLEDFRKVAPVLFGSVPNQTVVPFDRERHPYHVRHYTRAEIEAAVVGAGWNLRFVGGQKGKRGLDAQVMLHSFGASTILFAADR